jgi:hypothetical protein
MKTFLSLLLLLAFAACQTDHGKQKTAAIITPAVSIIPANKPAAILKKTAVHDTVDEQLDAYASYYIVVADTGTNYYALRDKMESLHKISGITIDTMDRFYNKTKDLIMLPDTSSDEIYAGDYYPRRYPSKNLSLEYMPYYKPDSKEKTIGLIAGIYENKSSADSALRAIPASHKAFSFKSKVYVGCMH